MSIVRRSLIGIVVAALLLMLTVGASTAMAFHIPGATYVGTHSDGGTVSFKVSASGLTITDFRIENYETGFCIVDSFQLPDRPAILNNSFSGGSAFLEATYSGTFPSVQRAQGTFKDDECGTGTLTWTAKTTASPAGSAECIAAQGPVSEAETLIAAATARENRKKTAYRKDVKRAKKAKRAVKRARNPKAKRRARKRLRRAVRRRSRSQRELRRVRAESAAASTQLAQAVAATSTVCDPVR